MKLLLHSCCAPCSIQCVKSLRTEGIEPHLFWYNPNISPDEEYKNRRNYLSIFSSSEKLELTFIDENINTEGDCEKCYLLRLEKTAFYAAENGFSSFTTTLLISPYQDHEAIKRIGEEAAAKHGVDFFYRDFRPLFRDGQNTARANGFYMQKYCGCSFSEEQRKNKQNNAFQRLELLTGKDNLQKLKNTNVLIFGVGGVGSWCAEALVRSGIEKITLIDFDNVAISNINRQIQATSITLGKSKVEVLKSRLLEINPDCKIIARHELFNKENEHTFGIEDADYVIDAIDMINNKLDLIEKVCACNATLFSSMGMALKMDPSQIKKASIWDTTECPLARLVRQGLRKKGFSKDFTVVYSCEQPIKKASYERKINGSAVTVTGSAGLYLASLVLRDVTGI